MTEPAEGSRELDDETREAITQVILTELDGAVKAALARGVDRDEINRYLDDRIARLRERM